jgi:hypothetical protein
VEENMKNAFFSEDDRSRIRRYLAGKKMPRQTDVLKALKGDRHYHVTEDKNIRGLYHADAELKESVTELVAAAELARRVYVVTEGSNEQV